MTRLWPTSRRNSTRPAGRSQLPRARRCLVRAAGRLRQGHCRLQRSTQTGSTMQQAPRPCSLLESTWRLRKRDFGRERSDSARSRRRCCVSRPRAARRTRSNDTMKQSRILTTPSASIPTTQRHAVNAGSPGGESGNTTERSPSLTWPSAWTRATSSTLWYRASCWRSKGQDARAIDDYELALKIDPQDLASRRSLGETLVSNHSRPDSTDPKKVIQYALDLCDSRVWKPGRDDVELVRSVHMRIAGYQERKNCDDKTAIAVATKLCDMTGWRNCDDLLCELARYTRRG